VWAIEEQIGPATCCSQGACNPGSPGDLAKERLQLASGAGKLVAILGDRRASSGELRLAPGRECVFIGTFSTPYLSGTITQHLEIALRTDGRIVGTGALVVTSGDGTTTPSACSSEIAVTDGHLE
jgi:hypothetical protein